LSDLSHWDDHRYINLTNVVVNDLNLTNVVVNDLNLTNVVVNDLNLTNVVVNDLNLTNVVMIIGTSTMPNSPKSKTHEKLNVISCHMPLF
jgi:uncharacterized protein YjbI with pentapeptide repeats